jgi:hypothetical protein
MLLRNLSPEKLSFTSAGTKLALRNPLFSNILRVNPSFAIFYPDSARLRAANSSLLKDLEVQSVFFLIRITPPPAEKKAPFTPVRKKYSPRGPSRKLRADS